MADNPEAPPTARHTFRLEAGAMLFFSAALAFVEGGTIAVLLKQTFAGQIDARWHNLAVALAGGAGEIANLISFGWIAASHGRPKARFINSLQIAMIVFVAAIGLAPRSAAGLWATLTLVLLARICWSGIVTLRTAVWRANYPARVRARVVGRLSVITQLVLAILGLGIGWAMDLDLSSYHWIAPGLAAVALLGVARYGRLRVRDEAAALAAERAMPRAAGIMRPWGGVASTLKVLRSDRRFAQFMLFMFLLGFGNLMTPTVLVIAMASRFDLGANAYKTSVFITTSLPYLLIPLIIPLWASLLDRAHVVYFRAIHGWAFVAAGLCFLAGLGLRSMPMMYAGSVCWGVASAGGALAWNLGHVDFAPPTQTSHYMATHVTLNGVRGLLAPLASSNLYNLFCDRAGAPTTRFEPGAIVIAVSLVLTILGCLGFVWLNASMSRAMGASMRRPRRTG